MRNNIPSVLIAGFVALLFLGAQYGLKSKQNGQALAAPVSTSAEIGKGHKTARPDLLAKIAYNPQHVLRLKGRDIQALLKAPGLVRRDLPTVIWQYRTAQCVLDVFFVAPSGDALTARPAHYEVRGRSEQADQALTKDCMRQIAMSAKGGEV